MHKYEQKPLHLYVSMFLCLGQETTSMSSSITLHSHFWERFSKMDVIDLVTLIDRQAQMILHFPFSIFEIAARVSV